MTRRGRNPYARPDARTRAARAAGFPARSVFKLEEIDQRVRILAPGQRVLDLGAAPGSWTLYAARRVGPAGRVLALDLASLEAGLPANVVALQGDALATRDEVFEEHGPFDVVLSDMAPSTSGAKTTDRAVSFRLFMAALDVACRHGRADGAFVGKIFMSEDFEEAKRAVADAYRTARALRPRGTRANSTEIFVVGTGRR